MMVTVTDNLQPLRREVEHLLIMSKSLSFQQKTEYLGLIFDLTEAELKEVLLELKKIK